MNQNQNIAITALNVTLSNNSKDKIILNGYVFSISVVKNIPCCLKDRSIPSKLFSYATLSKTQCHNRINKKQIFEEGFPWKVLIDLSLRNLGCQLTWTILYETNLYQTDLSNCSLLIYFALFLSGRSLA